MLLKTLPDGAEVPAYHITTRSALYGILKSGLSAKNTPRYGKVGDGIYVVFFRGNNIASEGLTFAEYLGIDEPAIIQTSVAVGSLLMDEDSLTSNDVLEHLRSCVDNGRLNDKIYKYFPAGLVDELLLRAEDDGDDDEDGLRHYCIELINTYHIAPANYIKTNMGHYQFDTARSTSPRLPVARAWYWNDEYELESGF